MISFRQSGSHQRFRTGLFRILTALALMAAAGAVQSAQTIDKLFAERARLPAQHARFVEIRTISELDLPLESRGELLFEPPATLRKKTLEPLLEIMELTGDKLSVTINGTRHSLPLDAAPAAAALASALRGLLAGNLPDVKTHFKLTFTASNSLDWKLRLTPVKQIVRSVLETMTVSGSGSMIEQIEIHQTNGDESLMRILPNS